jgi:lysophospholipase L1-like esterase
MLGFCLTGKRVKRQPAAEVGMDKRPYRFLGQAALLVVMWGGIFEAGLRAQQHFGPLYDLEMAKINLNWKSDVLNHKPAPEDQHMCIYGDLTGFSYKRSYDENGVRIVDDRELLAGCTNPISVLFLGDSFMEGYDDKNTLPYQVAKYFKKERGICIKGHNAGFTSYSPAIFVPQAKKLLPIVRPDYIVVDVDETDLFDDFARYRPLITRNERGQNVGVKASPIGYECSVGLMEARKHPLYLMRLVTKLWHSHVHMPAVLRENRSELAMFAYSQDHGADLEQKYREPLASFRQNLQELADVLSDYTGDPSRVLFIYHPHLHHLKPDASGRVWNDLVSSSVQKICAANKFRFFNATAIMKQRAGSQPENLYWKHDIHFSFKGVEEYSAAVAAFMASDMIKPND